MQMIQVFIASGFGMMVDVDWSKLFKSFYEVVRIKITCRDPSKIPFQRLYEMEKKLYLVSFNVEGVNTTGSGTDGQALISRF